MSTLPQRPVAPPLLRPTGVPGLDLVLGGGLPAGDLLFIIGVPGAGKTVMALQLAFGRIRAGSKALVLTTFSESHDKLIAHLSSFDFFDARAIGEQLQFLSIVSMLDDGAEETTRTIVRTVRQQGIDLVIIDGFRGIRDMFLSDIATRQFLQVLGTQLAYLGTTLVITVETEDGERMFSTADLTTADSIIALQRTLWGRQQRRMLDVRKMRGQATLPGAHRYHIDRTGVTIYPRLEALAFDQSQIVQPSRIPFGLAGLDTMLKGGLTTTTTTLLGGNPGTGKTLLALHYLLAGAAAGESGLYVTFHETPNQLADKARPFGLNLEEPLANDQVRIVRRPPIELDVDELANTILKELQERPVRRLVVDSIAPLQYALDQEARSQDYLAAIIEMLRLRNVTSLFLVELGKLIGSELDFTNLPIFALSGNMLLLRQVEYRSRLHRIISIVKKRFGDYDQMIREFVITERGIEIGEPLAEVEGQLTGIGHARGQPAENRSRRRQ
jgi:circadian clock protein KaiC